jgi:hypothetical protein
VYKFSLNSFKRRSSTLIEVNSLEVTVVLLITFFSNNVIIEDIKFCWVENTLFPALVTVTTVA